MNTNDLVLISCSLTTKQHAKLKRLSKNTHISMNIYIRKAVDNLLAGQRRRVPSTDTEHGAQEHNANTRENSEQK